MPARLIRKRRPKVAPGAALSARKAARGYYNARGCWIAYCRCADCQSELPLTDGAHNDHGNEFRCYECWNQVVRERGGAFDFLVGAGRGVILSFMLTSFCSWVVHESSSMYGGHELNQIANRLTLTGWVESLRGKEDQEEEDERKEEQTGRQKRQEHDAVDTEASRGLAQEGETFDEMGGSGIGPRPAAQDKGESATRGALKKCPNCHQAFARAFYSTAGWAGRGWCKLCRESYSRQVQKKRGVRAAQELGSQGPAGTPA